MQKRDDIIIGSLVVILLAGIFSLIYYSRPLEKRTIPESRPQQSIDQDQPAPSKPETNHMPAQETQEYQKTASRVFRSFQAFLQDNLKSGVNTGSTTSLQELKRELLAERVPARYRNLHLELVITLDRTINNRLDKTASDKKNQELLVLDKLNSEYPWLGS